MLQMKIGQTMRDAKEKIRDQAMSWNGVTVHPHRFGGIEFRLGRRELGHLHGDVLLDIPFPMLVRNEIVAGGLAEQHHVLPNSGWVSFSIHTEGDIEAAIALLRRSYDIARLALERKKHQEPVMQAEHL